jgi:EAL domain-containing protein (putative c-di-GMP-specific phosphodiesterase class I)
MVELGHTLEIPVVATGIEDVKTLEKIIGLGCLFGQGYLFSRPVSGYDLEELLRRSDTKRPAMAGRM